MDNDNLAVNIPTTEESQGEHMENAVVLASCFLQTVSNFVILYVYVTRRNLRRSQTLILLVSLAFIDFVYAIAQMVYITSRVNFCLSDGDPSRKMLIIGGIPASLMKSGCTIVSAIAVDRLLALYFPLTYYSMNRKTSLALVFLFSLLMAAVDFSLIHVLGVLPTRATYGDCCAFTCFISHEFKKYWGVSNMIVNAIPVVLTVFIMHKLRARSKFIEEKTRQLEMANTAKIDQGANRASIYILVVSIFIGILPGFFNGFSELLNVNQPYFVENIISACATLSGLSHAFIFGMAHTQIRIEIGNLCLKKSEETGLPKSDPFYSSQPAANATAGAPAMVVRKESASAPVKPIRRVRAARRGEEANYSVEPIPDVEAPIALNQNDTQPRATSANVIPKLDL